MTVKKNEAGTLLPMVVTEGVTVNVLPNERHEYLMTTREVANGYGTTIYVVNMARIRHGEELIEGKHYLTAVTKCYSGLNLPHNAVLWTKAGIVRLGFFIKSGRAKLFRDWAEELVLAVADGAVGGALAVPVKALPRKRNHNRITSERLIRLLTLTHRITDAELRNEIVEQLTGGFSYGN